MESSGKPILFIDIEQGEHGNEIFTISPEAEKLLQQSFNKKVEINKSNRPLYHQ